MSRKICRNGKPVPAHRDSQTGKAIKRAKRKLNREQKTANTKAKYGASGKPAPVTVKRLDGTVVEVVDQKDLTKQFDAQYRAENARVRNGRWFRPETLDEARERRAAWMREAK